ncbi:hypothetical protein ACC668_02805 [Rhizobium ruizarguesonis]
MVPPDRFISFDLDRPKQVLEPMIVLSLLSRNLGANYFPKLHAHIDEVGKRRQATISHVTVNGSNNVFNATTGETAEDRLLVATRATQHFFDELSVITRSTRVLIAFDGFTPDMHALNDWLSLVFIEEAVKAPNLGVILCGHQIPEHGIKSRATHSQTIRLEGVREPSEWLHVAMQLAAKLPGDDEGDQLHYLQGLIDATGGAPGAIVPILKSRANRV